jgi:MFS family permease
VRRILLRTVMFAVPAMALWALLPLIASQRLGLGADGFGALLGAFGLGAILGAMALGRARDRLSNNGMLGAAAGLLYAAATAVIVLAPGFPAALATLVFAGLAWMAATSTLAAELQLLPAWVHARGLAIYTVTFTGSMTAGSLLWGLVAEGLGLQITFLIAAGVMFAGVIAGMVWRVPETGHLDPQPVVYWPAARLAVDPEADAGPVMVTVEYTIHPKRKRPSSKRWTIFAAPDAEPAQAAGSCTGRRPAEPLRGNVQRALLGGA